MLFDVAAWVVILLVAWAVGSGVLALLRADELRPGDRYVIATWIGVIALSVALLGVSVVVPLRPVAVIGTTTVLLALGVASRFTRVATPLSPTGLAANRPRWPIVAGALCLGMGAAALTSDAVTLYDSLVYHVGIVQWLGEHGTVPGMALVHNRLGHVSAWFTLAAAFDHGAGTDRAATVPLGVALVLVGLQTAIALGRAMARRAVVADWFSILLGSALVWAVAAASAATPSPDVATNVLIVVAAWSLLVVSETDDRHRMRIATNWAPAIPLILALGATTMKLFAAPAAVVAATYFVATTRRSRAPRALVRPALLAIGLAAIIVGPFLAANVAASGCPIYPSAIGCVAMPWSVGTAQAADYAEYIRDVARWDRRGNIPPNAPLAWIVPWIVAHPIVTGLAVLSVMSGVLLLRCARRPDTDIIVADPSSVRAVIAIAVFGTALAAWQAPAPRFFFAVVMLVPSLVLSLWLYKHVPVDARSASSLVESQRFTSGFVTAAVVFGFVYALASQKLNIRSAVTRRAPLVQVSTSDLVLPAAPEAQTRLYRWRVNDVDVLTPVPLPIADTLGYHSVIAYNAAFEKCSTAPLPCTPYIPGPDVRLRTPARGLAAGFMRSAPPALGESVAACIGAFSLPTATESQAMLGAPQASDPTRCVLQDGR